MRCLIRWYHPTLETTRIAIFVAVSSALLAVSATGLAEPAEQLV